MRNQKLWALAFGVLSACDTSSAAITNGFPVSVGGTAWSIASDASVEINGTFSVDSVIPFGNVIGASRLADGSFVVADARSNTLEFFSPKGNYVRTVGGNRGGQSQINKLASLLRCGDSLYVRDSDARAYKVFSSEGKFARSFAVPVDTSGAIAESSACNSSGTFVNYAVESGKKAPDKSQVRRAIVPFWLSGPSGTLSEKLGNHSGNERWSINTEAGDGLIALPLGKQSVIAIGKSRAYIGTADSFAIDVFALDGSRAGVIREPIAVQGTTSADIELFKARDTTGLPGDRVEYKKKMWQSVEFAKTLPAYTAMLVDASDNLWVRAQPRAPGQLVEWFVFTPQLNEIVRLALPASFHIFEIGNDYILGGTANPQTGVRSVRTLPLTK